jgi:hypothetical protein
MNRFIDGRRRRVATMAKPFRFLLKSHAWKRHQEPFSKTRRGMMRRAERRFIDDVKRFASV